MENPIIEFKDLKLSKLLVEKKLETKDLPSKLGSKIKMLKANVSRYNNGSRTTQFYETLMAGDDAITDAILDELKLPKQVKTPVSNNPTPPVPPIDTPPVPPIDTPPVPPIDTPPVPPVPPVKSADEIKKEEEERLAKEELEKKEKLEKEKKDKVTAIDNAIKEKMQQYTTKDTISISDLKAILGITTDLPIEFDAGSLRLRKVYKQPFYRLK